MIATGDHTDSGSEERDGSGKFLPGNRHRFPPGESGNPGGRPKGHSPTNTIKLLASKTEGEIRSIAQDTTRPVAMRMIAKEWLNALDGDSKTSQASIERLVSRHDGPVKAEESGDQHEQAATQVRLVIQGDGVTVKEETDE